MTLLDLYKQITKTGRLFATWSIPMDKEVHLDLKGDNQTGYYVEVTTTKNE